MLRIVQAGSGSRRLLFISFFTANTAALLASVPRSACVMVDLDDAGGRFARPPGKVGVETIGTAVARAMHEADFDGIDGVILIGWSAGCQAVRELIRAGINVDAVIALDGCSGSVPPTVDQLAPWIAVADRARAGSSCVVLTHTAMGYTERLPVASRYESTTHTIAAITGTAGDAIPVEGQPVEPIEGSLYVLAYPSADIDGDAHIYQQTHVMPDVLRRIVVPWLLARAGQVDTSTASAPTIPPPAPTQPTGSIPPPPPARAELPTLADVPRELRRGMTGPDVMDLQIQLTRLGYRISCDASFGPLTEGAVKTLQTRFSIGADGVVDGDTRAAIDAATDSLRGKGAKPVTAAAVAPTVDAAGIGMRALTVAIGEIGTHEIVGPKANPRIVEYLSGVERAGHHLDLGTSDEPAWCAAFRGWCEHEAAQPNDGILPWRASVAECWADADMAHRTRPRTWTPRPGDCAIFARSGGDPRRGGPGHIARVSVVPNAAGEYTTIGGNESDQVKSTARTTSDPALVGWIEVN